MGTAPPAIDRVVAAKILVACQHRLPEFSERQTRSLVALVAIRILVHVQGKGAFVQARPRRPLASCEPIKQSSDFPVSECAPLVAFLMTGEDIKRLHAAPRDEVQYPLFRGSKT